MTQSPEKGDLSHEIGERAEKSTFQIRSSWPKFCRFFAFLACRKINNLRVFNTREYFDSPRVHTSNYCVIYGLRHVSVLRIGNC